MSRRLYADSKKRRDKLQILADIIRVSNHETKVTRILRLANVQYNVFHEYIETLVSIGFMERVKFGHGNRSFGDKRTQFSYKASEMGLRWCEMVDEVYDVFLEGAHKEIHQMIVEFEKQSITRARV
jgi:predicted transcriptional regulator